MGTRAVRVSHLAHNCFKGLQVLVFLTLPRSLLLQLCTYARPLIRHELLNPLGIDLSGCRSRRRTVSSQVRHDGKQPLDYCELRPVMHFVLFRAKEHFKGFCCKKRAVYGQDW